jgi:hypothetical protein
VSSAIFLRHTPSSAGCAQTSPPWSPGLSMPYSNDPIEGANTKVKLLKRQMYGGGRFPVLRQRILLS